MKRVFQKENHHEKKLAMKSGQKNIYIDGVGTILSMVIIKNNKYPQ